MSVGTWGEIAGTATVPSSVVAGQNPDAFCGLSLRPSDSSVLMVAAGGHGDGDSNAAATLRLSDNAPSWQIRYAGSASRPSGVLYYPDGRPSARHTYEFTHYIAGLDAVLLAGCLYSHGQSDYQAGPGMDLFSLSTNDYLPRFTYPDINPYPGGYGVAQDGDGHIWTQTGHKFNVTTLTWSKPGSGSLLRFPAAFNSASNRIVAMQFGDGQGYDPQLGVRVRELDPTTGNSRNITFNSSAALTQFIADSPQYGAMEYCPLDGKFYFLHSGRIGTFYVVTPNTGTVWDMATYTPGGTAPPSTGPLCARLLWVPSLNGFVLQGAKAQNLRFLRMT
jgi:hypothetical protein